jgi:hypothetical protein
MKKAVNVTLNPIYIETKEARKYEVYNYKYGLYLIQGPARKSDILLIMLILTQSAFSAIHTKLQHPLTLSRWPTTKQSETNSATSTTASHQKNTKFVHEKP